MGKTKPLSKTKLDKLVKDVRPSVLPKWIRSSVECQGVHVLDTNDIDFNTHKGQIRSRDTLGKRVNRLIKTFENGYDVNELPPSVLQKDNGTYIAFNGFGRQGKNLSIGQTHDIFQVLKVTNHGKFRGKKLAIWMNRSKEEYSPNTQEDLVNFLLDEIQKKNINPKSNDRETWVKELTKELNEGEPQYDSNSKQKVIDTVLERMKNKVGPKKFFTYSRETLIEYVDKDWAMRQHDYHYKGVPQPKYGFKLHKEKPLFNPDGPNGGVWQNTVNTGREWIVLLQCWLQWLKSGKKEKTELLVRTNNKVYNKKSLKNQRQRCFDNFTAHMKNLDNLITSQGGEKLPWKKIFKIIAVVPQDIDEDKVEFIKPSEFEFDYYKQSK